MSNQAENLNTAQGTGSGMQKAPKDIFMHVVDRAKAILLKPAETWTTISNESTSVKEIYQNYLVILAAFPALASFIAFTMLGISIPGTNITWRAPFFGTLVSQIIHYVVSLAMVYVAALVIEKLAPKFEAKVDTTGAFKLVAYSMTPAWVGGIFVLFPWPIMVLMALAGCVYSIYVFLLGVQPMTAVPEARKTGYVATSALIIIVLAIIMGYVIGNLTPQYGAQANNPQMMQQEQLKQFEESMKALQKAMPGVNP